MEHNKEHTHEHHATEPVTHHEDQAEATVESASSKQSTGLNVAQAVIIAGVVIAVALFFSLRGNQTDSKSATKQKTVVEAFKIDTKKLKACFDEKRYEKKIRDNMDSYDRATKHVASQGRGTPYSVAIAKDGTKREIAGAYPLADVKSILNGMLDGKEKSQTEIDLDPITAADHYFGPKDADIVIVEYSDLECPYCAMFHKTLETAVKDYNGKVAWVYRHFPLESIHQFAFDKSLTSECIAELGGEDAFWKYLDQNFAEKRPKEQVFDPLTGKVGTEDGSTQAEN